MAMIKAKLFWRIGDQTKKIIAIPYDDSYDYYSFVKEQHNAGYRQVIVTSESMINLIQVIVIGGFQVFEIEMAEDDSELANEIGGLLERVRKNPACLSELVVRLGFLAEKSSIEIQRIRLKGRTETGTAVMGFIQSNGLFGVNSEMFEEIAEVIGHEVGRFVFGC